jgi:hypothetical protein
VILLPFDYLKALNGSHALVLGADELQIPNTFAVLALQDYYRQNDNHIYGTLVPTKIQLYTDKYGFYAANSTEPRTNAVARYMFLVVHYVYVPRLRQVVFGDSHTIMLIAPTTFNIC